MFVVNAFVCLLLLNLSDYFGGRKVILLNCALIILCYLGAALIDDYEIKMILIGLALGCEGDFIPLFLFMMTEVTCRH